MNVEGDPNDGAMADDVVTVDSGIDSAIDQAFAAQEGGQVETTEEPIAGQPRDPHGRFAARAAQEAAALAQPGAQDQQQPAQATADVGAAPAAWGKDRAALFASLPPDAQAFISQREQQISEGFRTYEGLAPFAEAARGNGMSLRDVMGRVKEIEDLFNSDPKSGFLEICRRSGFDARQVAQAVLGGGDAQPEPQPSNPGGLDPASRQLIEGLQRQVQDLTIQPFVREVETFANDPANKHFDRLAPVVKQILAAEPQLLLKDAYDRACWADPQVRAELMAESNKQQQLAKSTQTAQRASRGLTTSSTEPVNGKRFKTVDEAVEAAFAAHS